MNSASDIVIAEHFLPRARQPAARRLPRGAPLRFQLRPVRGKVARQGVGNGGLDAASAAGE